MKNKRIVLTILMVLMLLIVSVLGNYNIVRAYSGEIDPNSYITLPYLITISNKIGTGTMSISSSASGYKPYYQKVDITKATYDSLNTKITEINSYTKAANAEIKTKEANLTTLKNEYQTLHDDKASNEEIAAAETKYNEAYEEYKSYIEEANKNIEKMKTEYYALIPDYTNSWTETTNTSNNISLDFSNYSGTIYFVLWAKIDDGTNTYYDFSVYSNKVETQESTDNDNDDDNDNNSDNNNSNNNSNNNENQNTDNNGSTTENGDNTDYSKATIELKKNGMSGAVIEISGITTSDDKLYYAYISSSASKPDITKISDDDKMSILYDTESKTFKTFDSSKLAQIIERNQDLYLSIIEYESGNEEIVYYGKKLERFSEPQYTDAFFATFMTDDATQIVTNYTHAEANNRKMQMKIGKITDTAILNKIKNKDSSGFSDLLTYAKSASSVYNKTVEADKDDSFAIEYNAGKSEGTSSNNDNVISVSGLEDDAYYYLYIKTDDEDGKYVSNEAVTLAQASVKGSSWSLFFYGSSDFAWASVGNVSTGSTDDTTTASGTLPQTGTNIVLYTVVGIMLIGAGVIFHNRCKKYKEI